MIDLRIQVSANLKKSLVKKVKALAAEESRTFSAMIELLVEEGAAKRKKKSK